MASRKLRGDFSGFSLTKHHRVVRNDWDELPSRHDGGIFQHGTGLYDL